MWQRLKAWLVGQPLEAPPPPSWGRVLNIQIAPPIRTPEQLAARKRRHAQQRAHNATQVNVCLP